MTIRITVALFLVFCLGIPLLSGISGFGISELLKRQAGGIRHAGTGPGRPGVAVSENVADKTAAGTMRDVTGVFVSFTKNGGVEVSFGLSGQAPDEKLYVWIVMNPDSPTQEGMLFYPRSPVFRGLPLDYRNGVLFDPSRERTCTVQIPEGTVSVAVDRLRILIYSEQGAMLADTQFAIGRNPGP